MRLLLVETEPGTATALKTEMTNAGHTVLSCYEENPVVACRSVNDSGDCPLHSTVDLAIVAREPGAGHTLFEMGSICAQRHRVPVLVMDPTMKPDHVQERLRDAAVAGREDVERALAAVVSQVLDVPATVNSQRFKDRVHVTIALDAPCDGLARSAIADRARAAARSFDPFVRVIDVSVTDPPIG